MINRGEKVKLKNNFFLSIIYSNRIHSLSYNLSTKTFIIF
jgi:hypothetical protein